MLDDAGSRREFRERINDAFTLDELKGLVSGFFNQPLDDISTAGNFNTRIDDLINWARRRGTPVLETLVTAVARERPDNDEVQKFVREKCPELFVEGELKSAPRLLEPTPAVAAAPAGRPRRWRAAVSGAALAGLAVGVLVGWQVVPAILRPDRGGPAVRIDDPDRLADDQLDLEDRSVRQQQGWPETEWGVLLVRVGPFRKAANGIRIDVRPLLRAELRAVAVRRTAHSRESLGEPKWDEAEGRLRLQNLNVGSADEVRVFVAIRQTKALEPILTSPDFDRILCVEVMR